MKLSRILPPLVAALVAGAGGYFFGRSTAPPPPEINKSTAVIPPSPPRQNATGPAVLSRSVMALIGTEPVTPANAGRITYRILEEPDPVARMTACLVLLESMTADNAQSILAGFEEITKKTGRRHDAEWNLMLRAYGRHRGAEGIKALMPAIVNVRQAVEGLAAYDDATALQAIKDAGITDPSVISAWLNGVCVKDPARALTLALSGKYNEADGVSLFAQAIGNLGVDKARDVMQAVLEKSSPEVTGTDVFRGMFEQLADSLFHKNLTLGTPGEMLPWLEQQKGADYVRSHLVNRAVDENFARDTARTLNFLDTMNAGRPVPYGVEGLYKTANANPKIIADLSEADCKRFMTYLYPNPPELMRLADAVAKFNPARADQLRTGLLPPGFKVPE